MFASREGKTFCSPKLLTRGLFKRNQVLLKHYTKATPVINRSQACRALNQCHRYKCNGKTESAISKADND